MNQENQNITQTNGNDVLETLTPISNEQTVNPINAVPVQPSNDTNTQQQNVVNQELQIQNELHNIPTVEQDTQAFINNVQAQSQEKKDDKKDGVNFVFIIVLFAIILSAIIFLFPILLNYV